jgi:phosphonate transport system substrate-binding protein
VVRFGVPPSLGSAEAMERAKGFAEHLELAVGAEVALVVARNYRDMSDLLVRGHADAVWAPPFVCARLEAYGMRVAVRGVRAGASTYCAALVCRRPSPSSLEELSGARAAWVDPDSVGGYLLAVSLLKSKGLDPDKTFIGQEFVGSYKAALTAVTAGKADVASIFAAPRAKTSKQTGIVDVLPEQLDAFDVVGHSEESPNDGVVVSPKLEHEQHQALTRALLSMHGTAAGRAVLAHAFRVDSFEVAPSDGYRALYKLAVAAL